MVTVILIYLLIGWFLGFIDTIIICLNVNKLSLNDAPPIINIAQIILYWPWFLIECIFFLITDKGN